MSQFNFRNSSGNLLSGRLDEPSDSTTHTAVFAHCFSCSKSVRAASQVSRALAKRGIAVLRFDFTGLGESGGDFADTNFSSNVDDLIAAAKSLGAHSQAPSLLIGHSLGGAAALMAASKIESVCAVATVGAPSEPEHVTHLFENDTEEIEANGQAMVDLGGRSFRIKKQFLDDLRQSHLGNVLPSLKKPLLVAHSPTDETVSIEHARRIFEAAFHPKSFLFLDRADHLLMNPNDAEFFASILANWAIRYMP